MQDELIKRSDAIKAINLIQNMLFNNDILPVTPQTRERHDVIQIIIGHVWKVKEKLEKLPAVQPEPPWIPRDQKLPDYGYQVLVSLYDSTDVAHRVAATMPGIEEDSWMSPYGYKIEPEYVEAWMPFPRPYEGGGE